MLGSNSTPIVLATLLSEERAQLAVTRRGESWQVLAARRRSGAIHNTIVYDAFTQTLTIDLARRSAHMHTSRYLDTTS